MAENRKLPARPNLDMLKKLAKQRHKSLREKNPTSKLAAAQLGIAREYGFKSWRDLHAHITTLAAAPAPVASEFLAQFIEAALPDPRNHAAGSLKVARELLAAHRAALLDSFHVALILGDHLQLAAHLKENSKLAVTSGGPRNWLPLSYLCFSRFLRFDRKRSANFVSSAKLLLENGADPNTAFTNPGDNVRESALYGASGLANNAPLTKLLLAGGAKVDDGESLYHTAEHKTHACLKLLLAAKPAAENLSYCMCHKMDFEDPAGLKLFLGAGADPNFLIPTGQATGLRPLHFAIDRNRSPRIIEILLAAGADPTLTDSANQTPFALAARLGRKKITTLFTKRGHSEILTPLQQFLAACAAGDARTARQLEKQHALNPAAILAENPQFLIDAEKNATPAAIRLILSFNVDPSAPNSDGVTPLHAAAWDGNLAIAKLLVSAGANLDAKDHEHNATPLQWAKHAADTIDRAACLEVAAYLESVASKKWSVEKLPAHRKTHKITQWKPIMDAAFEGDAAKIEKLLAAGADPNILSTTPARYRPLHRAIEFKITAPRNSAHEKAVAALLAGGPGGAADPKLLGTYSNINTLTLAATYETRFVPLLRKYFEPLDIFAACALAEEKIVAALLQKNPALAKSTDPSGWTPLHHASSSNFFESSPAHTRALVNIAKLLLDHGASITATWRYTSGDWPIPILYGCTGMHDFPQMAEFLLQNGANPCDNESVYHAADEGHTHALALIEKYTPAKQLAEECTKCLVPQLHWGHTRGLPWLLAHGGNPNTVTPRFGTNALHEAAHRGASADTIKLLLEHGANPNTKTTAGKTAFQLAKNSRTLAALKNWKRS